MTARREVIENLKMFRELSSDQKRHPELLKERKVILYAATLLESEDVTTLGLCLDILENFIANESAHRCLLSTFGIYEALEALSIRMRNNDEKVHRRAIEITEILRNAAPPAYNTRNRTTLCKATKNHQLYLLNINDLNSENLAKFEQILLKIRGIISFLVDVEMKRCTVRICQKITIKEIIEKIYRKSSLKAYVVTKNFQKGTEESVDVMENAADRTYLEYPEVCSPKGKAITEAARNFVKNGNNIFKSVIEFWNESFYW